MLPPRPPNSCACPSDTEVSEIEPEVAGSAPAHAEGSDVLCSAFLARPDAVIRHLRRYDREPEA